MTTDVSDERDLVEAWLGGDRQAGFRLFERHHDAVARFFHHKVPEHSADLVQSERAGTQGGRARMLREAQALARLSLPNVVQVFEVGEHEGQICVAMEHVRGLDLARWLVLATFIAAGHGLQAAHEAGLVHRDFKPANVIVGDDGRVRVLDFGLARGLVGDVEARGQKARDRGAAALPRRVDHAVRRREQQTPTRVL